MIRLKVDDAALIDRVAKRFEAEGRADDNPEAFKVRLVAYNAPDRPARRSYKGQGKLTEIDGMALGRDGFGAIAGILRPTGVDVKPKGSGSRDAACWPRGMKAQKEIRG